MYKSHRKKGRKKKKERHKIKRGEEMNVEEIEKLI